MQQNDADLKTLPSEEQKIEWGKVYTDEFARPRLNGKLQKWVVKRSPAVNLFLASLKPATRSLWEARVDKGMNKDYLDVFNEIFKQFVDEMNEIARQLEAKNELRRQREKTAREHGVEYNEGSPALTPLEELDPLNRGHDPAERGGSGVEVPRLEGESVGAATNALHSVGERDQETKDDGANRRADLPYIGI